MKLLSLISLSVSFCIVVCRPHYDYYPPPPPPQQPYYGDEQAYSAILHSLDNSPYNVYKSKRDASSSEEDQLRPRNRQQQNPFKRQSNPTEKKQRSRLTSKDESDSEEQKERKKSNSFKKKLTNEESVTPEDTADLKKLNSKQILYPSFPRFSHVRKNNSMNSIGSEKKKIGTAENIAKFFPHSFYKPVHVKVSQYSASPSTTVPSTTTFPSTPAMPKTVATTTPEPKIIAPKLNETTAIQRTEAVTKIITPQKLETTIAALEILPTTTEVIAEATTTIKSKESVMTNAMEEATTLILPSETPTSILTPQILTTEFHVIATNISESTTRESLVKNATEEAATRILIPETSTTPQIFAAITESWVNESNDTKTTRILPSGSAPTLAAALTFVTEEEATTILPSETPPIISIPPILPAITESWINANTKTLPSDPTPPIAPTTSFYETLIEGTPIFIRASFNLSKEDTPNFTTTEFPIIAPNKTEATTIEIRESAAVIKMITPEGAKILSESASITVMPGMFASIPTALPANVSKKVTTPEIQETEVISTSESSFIVADAAITNPTAIDEVYVRTSSNPIENATNILGDTQLGAEIPSNSTSTSVIPGILTTTPSALADIPEISSTAASVIASEFSDTISKTATTNPTAIDVDSTVFTRTPSNTPENVTNINNNTPEGAEIPSESPPTIPRILASTSVIPHVNVLETISITEILEAESTPTSITISKTATTTSTSIDKESTVIARTFSEPPENSTRIPDSSSITILPTKTSNEVSSEEETIENEGTVEAVDLTLYKVVINGNGRFETPSFIPPE